MGKDTSVMNNQTLAPANDYLRCITLLARMITAAEFRLIRSDSNELVVCDVNNGV